MMQSQQQQIELLRQGLLVAPRKQRPGNVSDFRRLYSAIFSGIEKPLNAEQWLVDMTDLLKTARIPEENQVEVAKIQLRDVARTWWLAEEVALEKPITWDSFQRDSMKDCQLKIQKINGSGYSDILMVHVLDIGLHILLPLCLLLLLPLSSRCRLSLCHGLLQLLPSSAADHTAGVEEGLFCQRVLGSFSVVELEVLVGLVLYFLPF